MAGKRCGHNWKGHQHDIRRLTHGGSEIVCLSSKHRFCLVDSGHGNCVGCHYRLAARCEPQPVRELGAYGNGFRGGSWLGVGRVDFRSQMKRRIVIPLTLAITLLVSNFIYGSTQFFVRDFDIKYIAKNCAAIVEPHKSEIEFHITYDRSIVGAVYYFDYFPNRFSDRDFIAADRSILSEFFCTPISGCLFAPRLSNECRKGVT